MRVFVGKGYRVYFGIKLSKILIILCAGDKSTQEIDIKVAKQIWTEMR